MASARGGSAATSSVGGDVAFEAFRHQIRQRAGDIVVGDAGRQQLQTGSQPTAGDVAVAEVDPPRRLGVAGERCRHGERRRAGEIDDDRPTVEIRHEQVATVDVETAGATLAERLLLGIEHEYVIEHVHDDRTIRRDHDDRLRVGAGQRREHRRHEAGPCPSHRQQRRGRRPRRSVAADIDQSVGIGLELDPLGEATHRVVD